jgi:exopolysaccharide biosynthesis operon protein EpsL
MLVKNNIRARVAAWTTAQSGARVRHMLRASALSLAMATPLCALAQYQDGGEGQDRALEFLVGGSETWDSNFFRVPNDVARSEWITTAYVGLSLDKVYAQQRIQARVVEQFNRYKNFSYLNFDALNFDGAWRWHLTPRVSGSLTYAQDQSLVNYQDYRNFTQRNIRTTQTGGFSLDGQLAGGWHLLASVPYYSQKNSQPFETEQSYRESGIMPGIQYVWPSGSSITFNQSLLRGKFIDQALDPAAQFDTGYRHYRSELLLFWKVSGKSTLSASVGWVDRKYDNFASRDFSQPVGGFRYTWRPTVKLTLNAAAVRRVSSWQDQCSSYRVTDALVLGSSWQASEKTSLEASVNWGPSDFRGALADCSFGERRDRSHGARLGATWTPWRNTTIGASVEYQSNSSNYPGQNFDDTTAGINAAFKV